MGQEHGQAVEQAARIGGVGGACDKRLAKKVIDRIDSLPGFNDPCGIGRGFRLWFRHDGTPGRTPCDKERQGENLCAASIKCRA